MDYQDETIAAIATPVGVGGIGIIKISGTRAEEIIQKIFRPKRPVEAFHSFRLYLGQIIDPDSALPIDEVLVSVMRSPFSYTREDIVEINTHSGYALLSRMLQIVLQAGARLAKPGEFTLRAFLNGRIDLTQAEATIDLINTNNEAALSLAAHQLAGGFLKHLRATRNELLTILIELEASIDFPDDPATEIEHRFLGERIRTQILKPIKALLSAHSLRKAWYEGIAIALAGRVNVGKSSIFNRLLENERALVTPIPGTTRDVIEQGIHIKGVPVRLLDTAGIRKVRGEIEKRGVALAAASHTSSDIILLVVDRSMPLHRYDLDLLKKVSKKPSLVVINKIDLPPKVSEEKLDEVFGNRPRVYTSALTGKGFQDLLDKIHRLVMNKAGEIPSAPIVPNLRHANALRKAADYLEKAEQNAIAGLPSDIIAADLTWAKEAIDEITGEKITDEVIEGIFNRFCLGK
ncbi:MAG: tRNA uridine-5-carboxymethylaminomethyl(34) synthesis GTPase MnmE [Thermodesulfobacteriota bacterium]